jgi:hypothetical protein
MASRDLDDYLKLFADHMQAQEMREKLKMIAHPKLLEAIDR